MLGTKERDFASILHVSLEELVPHDHFYRHLERTLDLSFVREFVQDTYACGGSPSIDPIVSFTLKLSRRASHKKKPAVMLVSRRNDRLPCHWPPRSRRKRVRN